MFGAVSALAVACVAQADPTALQLVKKGDQFVGVQAKDKILQIWAEKSAASVDPNIWHVVYFDTGASGNNTDVKFGAGEEMGISHPFHPFFSEPKLRDVIDLAKVHVDSDRALQIASEQPLLKGLKLRYSQMKLAYTDDGVTWTLDLWSARVNDPTKDAGVGTVVISADTGAVLKSDLHPENARGEGPPGT